jgi:hypothetical protein
MKILNTTHQSDRLTTVDPKALNHILANSMIYYKPSHLRLTLGQLIGEGLIFAEGWYLFEYGPNSF